MDPITNSNSTIPKLAKVDDLPNELLFKILHFLHDDPETSNAASLVKASWRIFQSVVFSHYKLPNTPTDELSPLQELATTGTQHDQDRLLSFIRSVRFGSPWSLDAQVFEGFKLAQNVVHSDHIHILERMDRLTTLEFASSCFQWIDLDDEQLRGLLRVLRQPNLTEVSSSYFPGGYIPLCLFLFSPNLTTLKLEDNSLEPVDEMSGEVYRCFKGRLLHLYSQFPQVAAPALSVQELKLKGLGLINSFLQFAKGNAVPWSGPVRKLDLDCNDTYFVFLTSPDPREVLGNFLELVGRSVEELRFHIERESIVNGIPSNPSLGPILTAGLGQLRQLRTFDVTLTVYTTTAERDQERVVAFATSWLMSTFQSLPGDNVTDLRITYRFGLRPANNPTHELAGCRHRFKQALDSRIWRALDDYFAARHPKLLRCAIQIIFFHGNTLTALRYNPTYDHYEMSTFQDCFFFPESCQDREIEFDTMIQWDKLLS